MKTATAMVFLILGVVSSLYSLPLLDDTLYSHSGNITSAVFGDTIVSVGHQAVYTFKNQNEEIVFDSSFHIPGASICTSLIDGDFIYSTCAVEGDNILKKIDRNSTDFAHTVDSLDINQLTFGHSKTFLLVSLMPLGTQAVLRKDTFEVVASFSYPEYYTDFLSDSLLYRRDNDGVTLYDVRDLDNPIQCDNIPLELPNTLCKKNDMLFWRTGNNFGVYTFPDGFHKELLFSGDWIDHGMGIDYFWNDEYFIYRGSTLTTLWGVSSGNAQLLYTLNTPYEHQMSHIYPVYEDCFMMCGWTGDFSLLKVQDNEMIIENIPLYYNQGYSFIIDDNGDTFLGLLQGHNSGVLQYSFGETFELTNYFPNNTPSDKWLTRSEHYAAYCAAGCLKVYPADQVMENCILTIPEVNLGSICDTNEHLYALWCDENYYPYLGSYSVDNGVLTLQNQINPNVGNNFPIKILTFGEYLLCYHYGGHVSIFDFDLNLVCETVLSTSGIVNDFIVEVLGDYVYFCFSNHVKIYHFDGSSLQYQSSFVPSNTHTPCIKKVGSKLFLGCDYELWVCGQNQNTGALIVEDCLPIHTFPRNVVFDVERDLIYVNNRVGLFVYEYDFSICDSDPQLVPPQAVTLGNYPNPFKPAAAGRGPATTIYFETTNAHESAQIEIFNVRGQKVRELKADMSSRPNEMSGEISYSTTWDGTDSNGAPVAGGVYLYQLKADGKALGQSKMLLLK